MEIELLSMNRSKIDGLQSWLIRTGYRQPIAAGEFAARVGKAEFDNRDEFSGALYDAFKELTGAGLISADEMMECLALRSRDNARTSATSPIDMRKRMIAMPNSAVRCVPVA